MVSWLLLTTRAGWRMARRMACSGSGVANQNAAGEPAASRSMGLGGDRRTDSAAFDVAGGCRFQCRGVLVHGVEFSHVILRMLGINNRVGITGVTQRPRLPQACRCSCRGLCSVCAVGGPRPPTRLKRNVGAPARKRRGGIVTSRARPFQLPRPLPSHGRRARHGCRRPASSGHASWLRTSSGPRVRSPCPLC